MFFPKEFLEELRRRLPVSQVVSQAVQLKRSSKAGELQGLCPFHNEKTPSFTVSDTKGFYHCFGCGAHGDIIRFTTEHNGFQFNDAVKHLAQMAGMEVPKPTVQEKEKYQKQQDAKSVLKMATEFYQQQLQSAAGREALAYLKKRHIGADVIQQFGLGYAPAGKALMSYLKQQKVSEEMMLLCGLVRKNERGAYDYFRDRVMFPIRDVYGDTVAFGGRILGDGQPKYLNSPETDFYHKGEMLYNEDQAKTAAHHGQIVVVVEGYMDAIAMHRAGYGASLAPLGTAVTAAQLSRLWHLHNTPILCFDGDGAGQKAMARAMQLAIPMLQAGKSLRFVMLPEKMDPDDVLNASGPEGLKKLIDGAQELSQHLWQSLLQETNVSTPEGKAHLQAKCDQACRQIADRAVSKYYRQFFSDQLWQLGGRKKTKLEGRKTAFHAMETLDITSVTGSSLLLLLSVVLMPQLLKNNDVKDDFTHLVFEEEAFENVRIYVADAIDEMTEFTPEVMDDMLAKGGFENAISQWINLLHKNLTPNFLEKVDKYAFWQYAMKTHHLAHLRKECRDAEFELTEASEKKAQLLRSEIGQLSSIIAGMQQEFVEKEQG